MPKLSRLTRPGLGGGGRVNRVVRPFIRYSLRRWEKYRWETTGGQKMKSRHTVREGGTYTSNCGEAPRLSLKLYSISTSPHNRP